MLLFNDLSALKRHTGNIENNDGDVDDTACKSQMVVDQRFKACS